jgi:hypothetical protein
MPTYRKHESGDESIPAAAKSQKLIPKLERAKRKRGYLVLILLQNYSREYTDRKESDGGELLYAL